MTDTDLLSTAQVADLLGTTVATINRWAAGGRLTPAHKLPGKTGAHLFRRADVLALTAEPEPAA